AGFDIGIQDLHLNVDAQDPVSIGLPHGKNLALRLEPAALVVTVDGETVRFPIDGKHFERLPSPDADAPAEFLLESGDRRLMLLPSYLYADLGEQPRLQNMETTILLREEDWR